MRFSLERTGHDMGIRILIVEDEAAIADFLVRGLREEGYTVEHADDGRAAWSALRAGGWDLVLLDWWLPDEDGLSLLRRFRQTDRRTPVLFLTARDSVGDRVLGLDAGADDYLCKPFVFVELLARVRALGRRRETDHSPRLWTITMSASIWRRNVSSGPRACSTSPPRNTRCLSSSCVTPARSSQEPGFTRVSGTSGMTGCQIRLRFM